jgi:hypothetical protein
MILSKSPKTPLIYINHEYSKESLILLHYSKFINTFAKKHE